MLMRAIRSAGIAVGAFALHINVINAANIVPGRISHGHVTVCTVISEIDRDRVRNGETRVAEKIFFFLESRTNNSDAIDERVGDSRLWTLLIYSSMEMVISRDTSDRNRLALRAAVCRFAHTRYHGYLSSLQPIREQRPRTPDRPI